ncbi:Helix-turn-helix domain-containing protein [Thermomonospora echinospora]|uniref:Helix-turn-helix domain-containing protein n=1 Tax=Thermomonospora echinospora TaxID=1992 RepID=A0A1H6DZI3_9ACTN|nr:helix-turn-helix transcriptional regulator [Thermomonospora echinospora]SEG90742.1 Helix-turn-helix domain-containing protein [Thermomonospora echinospora]
MPHRDTYTRDPLIRTFGAFLRSLRESRRLTRQQLADALGCGPEWIEKLETAQRPPSEQTAKDLDTFFLGLPEETQGPFWKAWNEIRGQGRHLALLPGFSGYVEHEAKASSLHIFGAMVLHGLFQTEEYAYEVLKKGRTPEQAKQLVATRMERQNVLTRKDPPHIVAVFDAMALRRKIGNTEVMKDQLRHLIDLAEDHPNITIQLVPEHVGSYQGVMGAFTILGVSDGPNLVYVEGYTTGQLIDHPDEIQAYTRNYDLIRGTAASADESLSMLHATLENL